MGGLVDRVAPARLGSPFRWLLGSSWASNLGDGIGVAAGPLLVASQTDDPFLVALAVALQRLPWLLFGLYAGVLADRSDRRRLVAFVDGARAIVLAVLTVTIVTGVVSIPLVLATMFLLGAAETFADTATTTLLPMLVGPRDLGVANSRIMLGFITANQLAGPAIGAALFAIGRTWPFGAQAVLVGLGAVLVTRIGATTPPAHDPEAPVRQRIAEGWSWLWHHPPMRTLALTIVTFNVTFGAAWSVLVLYATERLDMGEIGFGLLSTASAVGGIVGAWSYSAIERHVSLANVMRIGLVIETLTHLAFATITVPALALAVMFLFGAHAAVWATTSTSVRQRAVPTEFQGRVASVYMMGVQGGIVVGSAIGGGIAQATGITGPFWFGFVGSALILAAIWRQLDHIAHADSGDAHPEPAAATPAG